MRIGAGAVRWDRRALVALLVILVPLAAALVPGDVWAAGLPEPLEDSEGLGHLACSAAVGSSVDVAAPPGFRLAHLALADEPVVAGWIGLPPTDRGPPRA